MIDGRPGDRATGEPVAAPIDRLHATLVRAYPAEFRRRFAAGMAYAFAQQSAESRAHGHFTHARFVLRSVVHAIVFGTLERIRGGRGRPEVSEPNSSIPTSPRRGATALISDAVYELRLAARRLAHAPLFAIASILTLALGIGATGAIFSVVHAVVIQPLPYPQADRLVWIWHTAPGAQIDEIGTSEGAYVYYREQSRAFERLVTLRPAALTLTDAETPERVTSAVVDDGFFELFLGGPPVLGRTFRPDDHAVDAPRVAVISHRLWRQRYGADADILQRSLQVEGAEYPIVGVLPVAFDYPSADSDVWLPAQLDPARLRLGGFGTWVVGRLKPGITAEDARADLQRLIPTLDEPYPGPVYEMIVVEGRLAAQVTPLKARVVSSIEQTLWILLGTVGFVLLTACANVANLFLVRSEIRRREVAVRIALGAGRSRMLLHFLAESSLLALAGGALGLALAHLGVGLLTRLGPGELPRLHEVSVSPPGVALVGALAAAAALVFGAVPALRRPGSQADPALRDSGRSIAGGHDRQRARDALVVAQVALALVLLVGAGLMIRSFWLLRQVDPGFDPSGGLTFRLSVSGSQYPDGADAARFQTSVADRLRSLPGVTHVAATSCLPLSGCASVNPLYEEGRAYEEGASPPAVDIQATTDGYFEAMGIGLRDGRLPTRADLEERTGAVVVNAHLAEIFWPGEDPLGKRVWPDLPSGNPWYEVVGVVDDVLPDQLTGSPLPTIYLPLLEPTGRGFWPYSLSFVVKGGDEQEGMAEAIRQRVGEIDPGVAVAAVAPLDRLLTDAAAPAAFTMVLLVVAGSVSLLLGTIGVYGVLAYMVSQRTGEIGVRMALGARVTDVRTMVLKQGASLAAVGIVVGVGGALAGSRAIQSILFGVTATDPATYTGVVVVLGFTALVASYLPARRASQVEPSEALRT